MSLGMNSTYGGADGGLFYRYYPSPPQHDYYGGGGGGSWADCSPNSSGRSVSPCDEYQPPVAADFLSPMSAPTMTVVPMQGGPPRVVKRRCTANKKERRRTQSINTAFAMLREHIPGIPGDTKLSKIKTLKHAIAYINHLMEMLSGTGDKITIDTARSAFRADLQVSGRRAVRNHHPEQIDQHHFVRRCPEVRMIAHFFMLLSPVCADNFNDFFLIAILKTQRKRYKTLHLKSLV
jgi:hypothetical protein